MGRLHILSRTFRTLRQSIFIWVLLPCCTALAQEPVIVDNNGSGRAVGFNILVGTPLYSLPEDVTYTPVLFMGHYRFPLHERKGDRFLSLSLDIIPHYGVVSLGDQSVQHEAGINCWLDLSVQLTDHSMLSVDIGTGPHYITVETERQAQGFAFSDNLFFVYRSRSDYTGSEIKFYCGFRHVSNASLMKPNGGIDNLIFGLGASDLF